MQRLGNKLHTLKDFSLFFKHSCSPHKTSSAFTLAETLIIIGMIGIIATLTLPTLMSGTNDKEIVAKVKKANCISPSGKRLHNGACKGFYPHWNCL